MTPAGQNYPIHEHTFVFWGAYLGVVMLVTIFLIGLFLYAVQRTSQAVREPAPEAPESLPARGARPELDHSSAA